MEKIKSWKIITKKGLKIQKNWKLLAERNNLEINVMGIPALSSFILNSQSWLKYKTFNSRNAQNKYLAANAIFLSTKHDDKILDNYFNILDDIFKKFLILKMDHYLLINIWMAQYVKADFKD